MRKQYWLIDDIYQWWKKETKGFFTEIETMKQESNENELTQERTMNFLEYNEPSHLTGPHKQMVWKKKGEYMGKKESNHRPKWIYPTDDVPGAGVRDDGGKMKWHLLPVPALLALTKVFHGGSVKYAEDQWRKGLKYSRIYRSMISHFMKWLSSDSSYDKELGTHHLMMVAWGCFVLYMYEVVYGFDHLDDRKEKGMLTDDDFEFIHTLIENKLDRHATQKEADRWWENEMAPTSKIN
jgi:hypothetical protein